MVLKNISPQPIKISGMVLLSPSNPDPNDGMLASGSEVNLQYGNNTPPTDIAMSIKKIADSEVLDHILENRAIIVHEGEALSMTDSLNYYYMFVYVDYVNKDTKILFSAVCRPYIKS